MNESSEHHFICRFIILYDYRYDSVYGVNVLYSNELEIFIVRCLELADNDDDDGVASSSFGLAIKSIPGRRPLLQWQRERRRAGPMPGHTTPTMTTVVWRISPR